MQISETDTPLYTRARRQCHSSRHGRFQGASTPARWLPSLKSVAGVNGAQKCDGCSLSATLIQENHVDESSPPHQRKCANAAARRFRRLSLVR